MICYLILLWYVVIGSDLLLPPAASQQLSSDVESTACKHASISCTFYLSTRCCSLLFSHHLYILVCSILPIPSHAFHSEVPCTAAGFLKAAAAMTTGILIQSITSKGSIDLTRQNRQSEMSVWSSLIEWYSSSCLCANLPNGSSWLRQKSELRVRKNRSHLTRICCLL